MTQNYLPIGTDASFIKTIKYIDNIHVYVSHVGFTFS